MDRPERLLAHAYVEAICQITDSGGLYSHLAADEIGNRLWAEIRNEARRTPEADLYTLTRAALDTLKATLAANEAPAAGPSGSSRATPTA